MRYAIYSRKSKFTGKGESVENQIQLCREYLNRMSRDGAKIIEVFEDEGFSGKDTNRPEFQRMLTAVKNKEFDYIICYRLDRISRSVSDFAQLIDSLSKWGVEFICIKEQFDTSNPMGRAMMHIASVFAQLERETIAERIRDNMVMLAKTGRWLGGATPFGYESVQLKNIHVDGKARVSFKLSPVDDEIEIVKLIYELYLEKRSLTKIETYLVQSGIKTRGEKIFKTIGIREMLSNPVYCIADEAAFDYFYEKGSIISGEKKDFKGKTGIAAYNRTKNVNGRQKKQLVTEWIIAVGKHEGTICSENWIEVQQYLDQNKLTYNYYKPQNPNALLSGVLVCAKCGYRMRPRVSSYREYKKGQPYTARTYSYQCELKRIGKKASCDCPNINGNILDDIVYEELSKYTQLDSADIAQQLKSLKESLIDAGNTATKRIKLIEQSMEEKNAEIKRLISALSKEPENSTMYKYTKREVEDLDLQISLLKQERINAEEKSKKSNSADAKYDIDLNGLQSLEKIFADATVEEKREAIKSLIDKITWDGQKVHVFLYGEQNQE